MNQQSKLLFFSTVLGFLSFYLIELLWTYIPDVNPITNSLFACCASSVWLWSAIQIHDVLINIILCIPLAIFLVILKPDNIWLNVAFAIIPSFIVGNYHLFQAEYSAWSFSNFAFAWSVQLFCLPLAVLLVIVWSKREKR